MTRKGGKMKTTSSGKEEAETRTAKDESVRKNIKRARNIHSSENVQCYSYFLVFQPYIKDRLLAANSESLRQTENL